MDYVRSPRARRKTLKMIVTRVEDLMVNREFVPSSDLFFHKHCESLWRWLET
jgi:hypothetical protein